MNERGASDEPMIWLRLGRHTSGLVAAYAVIWGFLDYAAERAWGLRVDAAIAVVGLIICLVLYLVERAHSGEARAERDL
jgi:hypothetical protein